MRASYSARGLASFVVSLAVACPALSDTAYSVGHVWNRQADWTVRPSSDHGTTNGNPDDDALGNPVWGYQYYADVPDGSDLDTTDGVTPWYMRLDLAEPMKWDSSWYNQPVTYWAKGDDLFPSAGSYWTAHFNTVGYTYAGNWDCYRQVPLIRWSNPCDRPVTLDIRGSIEFVWRSYHETTMNVDVDFALASIDASAGGAITPLFVQPIDKPSDDDSHENAVVPVSRSVTLDPGDQIIYTLRAQALFQGSNDIRHWINLYDNQLDLELTALGMNAIRYITAETLDSDFVPTGGEFGLGTLTVTDTCPVFVEAEWAETTYEGASFEMEVSLAADDSNDGLASGTFRDGTVALTDADGGSLLTGEVTLVALQEVELLGRRLPGGAGEFVVTGGALASDFGGEGDIMQITFDLGPGDISDFGSAFTAVSNITLIPEPATLGLLAVGAAALLRRRRRT